MLRLGGPDRSVQSAAAACVTWSWMLRIFLLQQVNMQMISRNLLHVSSRIHINNLVPLTFLQFNCPSARLLLLAGTRPALPSARRGRIFSQEVGTCLGFLADCSPDQGPLRA